MKIKLPSIIALLTIPFAVMAQSVSQEVHPTPLKLPEAHNAFLETATEFTLPTFSDIIELSSPTLTPSEILEDESDEKLLADKLTTFASKFVGTRYSRGASGPKAFDCSGFVGYVFRQFGIKLSRSSSTQFNEGVKINRDELKPGDLMFFSGRAGNKSVGHVAMVVDVKSDGSCVFIHASSSKGVTYQKFPDSGYYSKRYIGAKRIIGTTPKA